MKVKKSNLRLEKLPPTWVDFCMNCKVKVFLPIAALRCATSVVLTLLIASSCSAVPISQSSSRTQTGDSVYKQNSEPHTISSLPQAEVTNSVYQANPGLYRVGVLDNITLTDTRRGRDVPVKIYYPQGQGPFPVIIFSHGAGGSKEIYSYLGEFWASHGYVSIHPTHQGTDTTVLRTQGLAGLAKNSNEPRQRQQRSQDISFIIDSFGTLERQAPELGAKMDQSRIGVAGHSLGAYTTMAVAGVRLAPPWGQGGGVRDPRVRAFIAISPQGPGDAGLDRYSWDAITAPVMIVTGTRDIARETVGRQEQPASWRRQPFQYMPPGDKYLVLITGATHSAFGTGENRAGVRSENGVGLRRRRLLRENRQRQTDANTEANTTGIADTETVQRYTQIASLAFWDAYLKGETPARTYLKSTQLQTYSDGDVSVSVK